MRHITFGVISINYTRLLTNDRMQSLYRVWLAPQNIETVEVSSYSKKNGGVIKGKVDTSTYIDVQRMHYSSLNMPGSRRMRPFTVNAYIMSTILAKQYACVLNTQCVPKRRLWTAW